MGGMLVGTALQLQQATLWTSESYACFVLVALVIYALVATQKIADRSSHLALFLAAALLVFAATGLRASAFVTSALDPALEGQDIAVRGVVAALPQRNDTGVRFRFDVESARLNDKALHLPPRLELAWYSGVFGRGDGPGESLGELQRLPEPVQPGERWQFTVRLKAPHGAVNPHGFDYELWQWEQGVQATGYVRAGPNDPVPQRVGATAWHPVDWARQQLRERIYQQVPDAQAAGLIAALVVGDQGAIERADWDVFRATGVAHLMSISGLHITMFAWLASGLVGWGWRRSVRLCLAYPAPSAALLGGVLLALAYALFSGWGVPAQRTVLMLATIGLLRLAGLRWPWPLVWLLACAVVVAVDPWAMLQAGFWLSFVAVGVLFATDSGAQPTGKSRARDRLLANLREQWVITLALTPLTLLLFGQVSVVGLLANVLAIPWVTLVVTPLAMLGALLPGVWELAGWAIALLGGFLRWLAAWPWAVLSVAQAPAWAGAAGGVGGALLAMRLPWSLRLMGLPLLLPVLLWQVPQVPDGQFELLAADIGQGNAVLVRTAHHALLYDAGPRFSRENDAGHRVLVPLLRALDVRLDRVVLSHRDSDHTGGAAAVLLMQAQAQLLSSIEDDNALQALRPATRCVVGQRWLWDGVEFEVLHPQAEDYGPTRKTNAMSCVLRIANGQASALLVGDIEQPQEASLVARGANVRADVLLVPHHGSKTSSSAVFLDAVAPRLALVQAGYRNRFGHPAETVRARYLVRNITVLDLPHCGAIGWRSVVPLAASCQRQLQAHYWYHQVP